ncbi:hypothetical protein ACROYT_G016157 [Oculina patagonica]
MHYFCLVHSCSVSLGLEDKRIPDSAFTASGSYDNRHRPSLARLNILSDGKHIGAWCPKHKSTNQWLQVDLGEITAVTKVATQGRYNTEDRVKTYTLSYSVDGTHWTGYKQRATEKVFAGNTDRNTVIAHSLKPHIDARFIRFHPKTHNHNIPCLRVELYGCRNVKNCLMPAGVEDGRVPDEAFTASSSASSNYLPNRGRLNLIPSGGKYCWAAGQNNANQWLQHAVSCNDVLSHGHQTICFNDDEDSSSNETSPAKPAPPPPLSPAVIPSAISATSAQLSSATATEQQSLNISSVRTFGFLPGVFAFIRKPGLVIYQCEWKFMVAEKIVDSSVAHSNVTSNFLSCARSQDTALDKPMGDGFATVPLTCRSCFLPLGMESGHLPDSALSASTYYDARFIPRLARLNKLPGGGFHCSMSLGMEDGRVQDSAMTASSIASKNHAAKLGRLNLVAASSQAGAWCAGSNNVNQWLQIDLGTPTTVTKVATQGRQDSSQWVSSYSLSYSLTGSFWVKYTVRGKKKVFRGNFDRDTMVFHKIFPPFHARFVRTHPLKWQSHICMRAELYGCPIKSLALWEKLTQLLGEQGWRSGESARLPPMWPSSIPGPGGHLRKRKAQQGAFTDGKRRSNLKRMV